MTITLERTATDTERALLAADRLDNDPDVCGGPILASVLRDEVEKGELSGPARHIADDVLNAGADTDEEDEAAEDDELDSEDDT